MGQVGLDLDLVQDFLPLLLGQLGHWAVDALDNDGRVIVVWLKRVKGTGTEKCMHTQDTDPLNTCGVRHRYRQHTRHTHTHPVGPKQAYRHNKYGGKRGHRGQRKDRKRFG